RPPRASRRARADRLIGASGPRRSTRKIQFDVSTRGNRFSRMRILSAFCAAILAAGAPYPAVAAESTTAPIEKSPAATDADNRLDALFVELKRERNEKAAERIASRIWEAWSRSGSASIDLMMGWSKTAMDNKK